MSEETREEEMRKRDQALEKALKGMIKETDTLSGLLNHPRGDGQFIDGTILIRPTGKYSVTNNGDGSFVLSYKGSGDGVQYIIRVDRWEMGETGGTQR